MKDLLKIIILIAIIFASACVSLWYGFETPTYLSAKVICDAKQQPVSSTGIEATQIKLFGFECLSR